MLIKANEMRLQVKLTEDISLLASFNVRKLRNFFGSQAGILSIKFCSKFSVCKFVIDSIPSIFLYKSYITKNITITVLINQYITV